MDGENVSQELIQRRFNHIMQQLRWQLARLGTAGKIGVGLCVVAGIFFLGAVLPAKKELKMLEKRAETLQLQAKERLLSGEVSAVEKQLTNDQALQAFYEFFPRFDSSPYWIRELVRAAQKQGVEIN